MDIEDHFFVAPGVSSSADTETLDSYEEKLGYYRDNDFTYIPIPNSLKYYNQEKDLLRDLKKSQIVGEQTHLLDVMRRLRENPFLLLDYHAYTRFYTKDGELVQSTNFSDQESIEKTDFSERARHDYELVLDPYEFKNKYPNLAEEVLMEDKDRFEIITIYDLNKRRMKEMIYRILSELEMMVSKRIQNKYPESTSKTLLEAARPETIGRWEKSKLRGDSIHIVERMNLLEMIDVLKMSPKGFVKACGFSDKESLDSFDSINEFRNKVMHSNRTLVRSRKDITDVLSKINRVQKILQNSG